MRVDVHSRSADLDLRTEIEVLCHVYAEMLSLPDDIHVNVCLLKRIRSSVGTRTRGSGRIVGSAMAAVHDPKLFWVEVRIDDDMKATLIHELTHVAQFVSGRLRYGHVVHAFWDGKDMGAVTKIDYVTAPWEIEARDMETHA